MVVVVVVVVVVAGRLSVCAPRRMQVYGGRQ